MGPGVNNVDFSLWKTTAVMERTTLQFRGELSNVLNRAALKSPKPTVFTSARTLNGSAGRITTTATDNREIQLGLKLIF
jgi:hypothetical protein